MRCLTVNVSGYVGLNKRLKQPGSGQKLKDAAHVMEVLSAVEGMMAFNSRCSDAMLLPLKNFEIGEGSQAFFRPAGAQIPRKK